MFLDQSRIFLLLWSSYYCWGLGGDGISWSMIFLNLVNLTRWLCYIFGVCSMGFFVESGWIRSWPTFVRCCLIVSIELKSKCFTTNTPPNLWSSMALSYHHNLSFANIEQEELNLLVLEDHQKNKKTEKLSTSLGCALMLQYLRKYKEKLKLQWSIRYELVF